MQYQMFIFALFALFFPFYQAQQTELTLFDGLKVISATRNVDITSQIVKVSSKKFLFYNF